MIKTTNRQKIVLIIAGILFTLLFLEIGLRMGGFILLSMQRSENSIIWNNKDYRILTLGESTTADFIGTLSWPRQLEDILNDKSKEQKFKVFNEGVGGTNTAYILSRLEDNLDKYNPDMVITMMGINDYKLTIKYEESSGVKIPLIPLLLNNFRVYKLSKLLFAAWKNKLDNLDIISKSKDEFYYYSKLSQAYRNKENPDKAEEIFKGAIEINPENDEAYIKLGRLYTDLEKFEKAEEIFEKAIEINPENIWVYIELRWLYYALGKFEKAERIADKIEEMSKKAGFPIKVTKDISAFKVTEYHYRKLYERLNKRGIKYVAMQYPLLDVEEIRHIFNSNENIIFVSNKENFKEALRGGTYWRYFTDDFGGIFGHATEEGDMLIAENVAKVILKELNNT